MAAPDHQESSHGLLIYPEPPRPDHECVNPDSLYFKR